MDSLSPGNLALCRSTSDSAGSECLGIDHERSSFGVMKSRVDEEGSNSESTSSTATALNWRYENGLLRSVGPDGHATELCLGPSESDADTRVKSLITTLDEDTPIPYELVLRICPDIQATSHETENIFSHGTAANTVNTIRARSTDASTSPEGETVTTETTVTSARHMRFLIVGDGRIQSLALVRGKDTEDIVADKPFCVTLMNYDDDTNTKAYLAPCIGNNPTGDLERRIQREQQVFDTDTGSSFDPFLFNWQSSGGDLEFAYQLGYNDASSLDFFDRFDSYVIRVNNAKDRIAFDATVAKGSNPLSGIVSFPLSAFPSTGGMQAHLIGTSVDGLESRWLASTSFVVSESALVVEGYTNGWTWALVCFTCFMAFYVILVKCSRIFCPNKSTRRRMIQKKKKKRDSELTAGTTDGDNDWETTGQTLNRMREENDWGGRASIQLPIRIDEQDQILFRITEGEEELDLDFVDDSSSNDEDRISEAENTATSTTVESSDDLNTTADSNECNIDIEAHR